MSRFEILCVTMYQNDFKKIEEMNIRSNVVFANQCNHTSYQEIEFNGHTAKMISTQTRGVGINRNLALTYASAEICLFADDDVVYRNNVEELVLSEFDAHPDADIIIFHLETNDKHRKQIKYTKTKKCRYLTRMPWGTVRIAVRLEALRKANVWFTTLFGGGCIFLSGEDSIWLIDAKRKGLTFYVSKETIGDVSFETSTWFNGQDERYFYDKGAFYRAVYPKWYYIWMIYLVIRTWHNKHLSFKEKIYFMKQGSIGYKKMLSYDDYNKVKLINN